MAWDTLLDAGSNLTGYLTDTINHYFIRPQDDTGIGSVKLDIVGEQTLTMPVETTQNFVESNIVYQDQIALKPITYTIQGEVGELVYLQEDAAQTDVGFVNQKLAKVVSFLPTFSRKLRQVTDTALRISNIVDSGENFINRLSKLSPTENKQQQAYLALIALRNQRIPIAVNTPWTNLESFVIKNVELKQPRETKDKTFITIQLEEFRTIDELRTTTFNIKKYQSRLEDQAAKVVNQGLTNGKWKSTLAAGRKLFG